MTIEETVMVRVARGTHDAGSWVALMLVSLLTLLAVGAALPARAPVGPQFEVNSDPYGLHLYPAVASNGGDGFVVSWRSYVASDQGSIQARVFDGAGVPLADEFSVGTTPGAYHRSPAVSPDGSGGFIVLWPRYSASLDLMARSYTAEGLPRGRPVEVVVGDFPDHVSVSGNGAAGVVATWISNGAVVAQRLDADGTPVGGLIEVDGAGGASSPEASRTATGFVVSWRQSDSPDARAVRAHLFATDGTPLGSRVTVSRVGDPRDPRVTSLANGDIVVVWEAAEDDEIRGRRFDAALSPLGLGFSINTHTAFDRGAPVVVAEGSGFLVVWEDDWSGGGLYLNAIHGRRFDGRGQPLGDQFLVSTFNDGGQVHPDLAVTSTGSRVAVWQSSFPGSIEGQRFETPPFFADGFESGDTGAWSLSVP